MNNLFAAWRELVVGGPLLAGTVTGYDVGVATVQLPGGGELRARGEATVGQRVFLRDGVIEGPAPELPANNGEV